MKYSIRGVLNTSDGSGIVDTINNYPLWRLVTNQETEFSFEVWVNSLSDKDGLYADLKLFVDGMTGVIDWHECTHDESQSQPCVIAEEYRK